MDLESYAEMGAKVKQSSLIFNIHVEDETDTPTSQRYHTSRFIICLSNIILKIALIVQIVLNFIFIEISVNEIEILNALRFNFFISLQKLPIYQIIYSSRKQLAYIRIIKVVSEHSRSSRDHEVTGENRRARPKYFMGSHHTPSRVCFVDDVILK
jgi:hypothetical protein